MDSLSRAKLEISAEVLASPQDIGLDAVAINVGLYGSVHPSEAALLLALASERLLRLSQECADLLPEDLREKYSESFTRHLKSADEKNIPCMREDIYMVRRGDDLKIVSRLKEKETN